MEIDGIAVPDSAHDLVAAAVDVNPGRAVRVAVARAEDELTLVVLTEVGVVLTTASDSRAWGYPEIGYAAGARDQTGVLSTPGGEVPLVWEDRRAARAFRESFEFRSLQNRTATAPGRRPGSPPPVVDAPVSPVALIMMGVLAQVIGGLIALSAASEDVDAGVLLGAFIAGGGSLVALVGVIAAGVLLALRHHARSSG